MPFATPRWGKGKVLQAGEYVLRLPASSFAAWGGGGGGRGAGRFLNLHQAESSLPMKTQVKDQKVTAEFLLRDGSVARKAAPLCACLCPKGSVDFCELFTLTDAKKT